MTSFLQISTSLLAFNNPYHQFLKKPSYYNPLCRVAIRKESRFFLGRSWGRNGVLVKEEGWRRKSRVVLVRFNQGFGFNGGGGGGGGPGGGDNGRILGNIALAVGLTYLSITGQLGWILDAIVSFWLFVVIVPIVGFGVFLWWAGRDIIQDQCPNCGNDFQVFKSTLNDELQLCPFCSQPFSVVDSKFVGDPVNFSNKSSTFGQAFSDFVSGSKKGNDIRSTVVDVEAEVKDAD